MRRISIQAREIFETIVVDGFEISEKLLEEYCEHDARLISEVQKLLDGYNSAASIIDSALGEKPLEAQTVELATGDEFERYTLTRKLGVGGFGQVFEARQNWPVSRQVAVKLIKPGTATKENLRRFDNERQSLAILDHPNIARVLDVGANVQGRPFFVMDLVSGEDIATYCNENRLSTASRVLLFTKICRAIQHAHHKGIIHRDIKASNILVESKGGEPEPKVIDFGIAKFVQDACADEDTVPNVLTQTHSMLGTPLYMSPEQVANSRDIDTRSDIFSLGIVLYQLLAGKTPLEFEMPKGAGLEDIRKLIVEKTPRRPSEQLKTTERVDQIASERGTTGGQLKRTVRGDLDWIVMKAIEKDRERRYSTADEFADDLVRWQNQEAIQARPPSATYLLGKMIRQHRVGFGIALLVFVALTAMSAYSLRMATIAKNSQAHMKHLLDLSFYILEQPDINGAGQNVRVLDLLSGIVEEVEKLEATPGFDKEMGARFFLTIGRKFLDSGVYTEAAKVLQKAVYYMERCGKGSELGSLSAKSLLAFAYGQSGQPGKAMGIANDTLVLLEESSFDVSDRRYQLAKLRSLISLTRATVTGREFDEARQWARKAIGLAKKGGFKDLELIVEREWIELLNQLSTMNSPSLLSKTSIYSLSKKNYQETVAYFGANHYQSYNALYFLATQSVNFGKLNFALQSFDKIVNDLSNLISDSHHLSVGSRIHAAHLSHLMSDYDSLKRRNFNIRKIAGDGNAISQNLRTLYFRNLVAEYSRDKRFEQAKSLQSELIELLTLMHGADSPETARAITAQMWLCAQQKDYFTAELLLGTLEKLSPNDPITKVFNNGHRVFFISKCNNPEKRRDCVESFQEHFNNNKAMLPLDFRKNFVTTLASYFACIEEYQKSSELFDESIEIAKSIDARNKDVSQTDGPHPKTALVDQYRYIGVLCIDNGQIDLAEKFLRRGLEQCPEEDVVRFEAMLSIAIGSRAINFHCNKLYIDDMFAKAEAALEGALSKLEEQPGQHWGILSAKTYMDRIQKCQLRLWLSRNRSSIAYGFCSSLSIAL